VSFRTVIVTGAGDGIGAAAAVELARRGDRVVIVGRSPEKTQAVAERVEAAAADPGVAARLWDLSADLVGVPA
jgi:NAD(P)-dependent dehydrogenase (short-subunit alcohol dehydrogenase family)